jgi:hypothetical protein
MLIQTRTRTLTNNLTMCRKMTHLQERERMRMTSRETMTMLKAGRSKSLLKIMKEMMLQMAMLNISFKVRMTQILKKKISWRRRPSSTIILSGTLEISIRSMILLETLETKQAFQSTHKANTYFHNLKFFL